jgi:hypothetical protein
MERKRHRLPIKVASEEAQVLFEMKLQVIRSKGRAARLFVNVPLALAAALDMHPGERLRWQLLDRSDLRLVRLDAPKPKPAGKK